MDAIDCMMTRRSVRKYKNDQVSDGLIGKLLEAAMNAPSAGNQQPWQFIVVNDANILKTIAESFPFAGMAKDASVGILVCADKNFVKYEGFWIQDCAACVQNILLAAHSLGLGAVWTGIYPREDRLSGYRKIFDLPESITPFAFIPIGYPAEEKDRTSRFNDNRIHMNKW